MPLIDLFRCTAVLDGGPSLDKAELIGRLLTLLAQAGHISHADMPGMQAALMRREQLGSTGIGRGLAIPHLKHPAVARPLGILAVCRPPVGFESLDGEPVDIVALCLFPIDRPGQHLGEALRGRELQFRRLVDEGFCRRLRQADSAEEILEIVRLEDGMTRREWTGCKDPDAMLRLLRDRGLLTERKARLFGAACCRWHWDLLPDQARRAVEVVERLAEEAVSKEEQATVRREALRGLGEVAGRGDLVRVAVSYLLADARLDPAGYALDLSPWTVRVGDNQAERATQAGIICCLFGSPPFDTPTIKPEWLAFSGGVAVRLGRGIHDERAFDCLPILADALEDAGCESRVLLDHFRSPGPHWRGCFALDAVLGKS